MNATQLLAHFGRLAEAPNAVPRLRRLILDLAVRGKLVEQDAGDEPAEELLKRIKAAKAIRIKSGELRNPRDLDFSADEEEMLYKLPSTWHWVRLADVGAIIGGGTPPSGDFANFTDGGKGFAWLTPADLGKHKNLFVSHGARDLTEAGMKAGSATLMPAGSVLFTSRAPIGYTAIAANKISTNQGFKSVVPYLPECSKYIAIYLQAFAPWVNNKATGTTFKEVSGKIVSGLPFPLPPVIEQHRIIAKVDELMALCDQLEAAQQERERCRDCLAAASLQRLNQPATDATPETQRKHARFHLHNLPRLTTRPEHVKAMRQTILSFAVSGRLVNQYSGEGTASELLSAIKLENQALKLAKGISSQKAGVLTEGTEASADIPSTWLRVSLQDLSYQITDGTHLTPKYTEQGKPFLSAQNVKPFRFIPRKHRFVSLADFESYRANRKPERGDVLLTRVGAGIGEAAVLDSDFEFAFYVSLCLIKVPIKYLLPEYLVLWLNSPEGRECSAARTYGKGASQGNLNLGQIRTFNVPVPPVAEQHRIVAKVDELMALCDQLEAQLTITQTDSRLLLEAVLDAALTPA